MKKNVLLVVLILPCTLPVVAQQKENERISESAVVIKEIFGMPDGIPKDLLNKADCLLIYPSAGPVGRAASAQTDIVMKAEILSYSRSKGLFAGLSLEGSTMRSDDGANKALYRRVLSAKEIVREGKVAPPPSANRLLAILRSASPKHTAR